MFDLLFTSLTPGRIAILVAGVALVLWPMRGRLTRLLPSLKPTAEENGNPDWIARMESFRVVRLCLVAHGDAEALEILDTKILTCLVQEEKSNKESKDPKESVK